MRIVIRGAVEMTHAKNTDTPIRFVTAASLFDGHDASINIMRRVLQAQGAEVIHLGHDRSAHDVVEAAIQEDAHGIAVSSYQGGHIEYFSYARGNIGKRARIYSCFNMRSCNIYMPIC